MLLVADDLLLELHAGVLVELLGTLSSPSTDEAGVLEVSLAASFAASEAALDDSFADNEAASESAIDCDSAIDAETLDSRAASLAAFASGFSPFDRVTISISFVVIFDPGVIDCDTTSSTAMLSEYTELYVTEIPFSAAQEATSERSLPLKSGTA